MSRVGVVGLGLIGGSFAKAYHAAGWEVLASNRTKAVLDFAILSGEVDGELTKENVGDCDLVLVTIYPEAAIQAIRDFAPYFGRKPLVMDCCGTKRVVCEAVFPIAEECGFSSLSAFTRNFKKFLGTTPYQWKLRHEPLGGVNDYNISARQGWQSLD